MKKILLFASALAGLFLAASCQQESLEPVGGNTVTYTVQVPDALATKAVGDEYVADHLIYEVYRDAELSDLDKDPIYEGTATINAQGQASLELEFVKNQNFTVLFWAQKNGVTAYTTEDLRQVTLDKALTSNDVNMAVYAGTDKVVNCVSATNGAVTLSRPIAQLNLATAPESLTIGTNANPTITLVSSYAKVTGLSTTYNVATKAVGTDESEFIYADASVLDAKLEVNSKQYPYASMNYVGFIAEEGATIDVEYILTTSEGKINHTIGNVPVKPNYRTNIVGNLISSASEYAITLDAVWAGVAEEVEIWDGEFLSQPAFDAATSTWSVKKASELAWLAAAVNGEVAVTKAESYSFAGETFVLTEDIDLGNYPWTPIGLKGDAPGFRGTFDGQNHTISNLYVDLTAERKNQSAGLFGSVYGTLKNFTVKNATIKNLDIIEDSSNGAAVVVGAAQFDSSIENVHVVNATVSANKRAAGIAGYLKGSIKNCTVDGLVAVVTPDKKSDGSYDNGDKVGGILGVDNTGTDIDNCTVRNSYLEGYRDLGGIAAVAHKSITNCTVENVDIVHNPLNGYKTSVDTFGAIHSGRVTPSGDVTTGNQIINVTIYAPENVTIVKPEESLQAAIDAAVAPAVIYLAEGTHTGHTVINKSVTLLPVSGASVIYDGHLSAQSGDVLIQNITFTNEHPSSTPVPHDSGTPTKHLSCVSAYVANVTLENCTFDIKAQTGYFEYAGSTSVLKNCVFKCNGQRPIQSRTRIDIDGCKFYDQYRYAVQVQGEISGNQVVNFKNNQIINPCVTSGKGFVAGVSISGSKKCENVTFNIEGNTLTSSIFSELVYVYDNKPIIDIASCTVNGATFVREDQVPVITFVTPSELATTDFTKSGTYMLMGDFSGVTNMPGITPTEGAVVVIDASGATFGDVIKFSIPQAPDNANVVSRDNGRKGSYTLTNFKETTLALGAYGTSINITGSKLDCIDVYAANIALDINSNTIDCNYEMHPRYTDGSTTDYAVNMMMMSYDLKFHNNTVSNAIGHIVAINGLIATFDSDRSEVENPNWASNVVSYTGNTMSGIGGSTKNARAGFKLWDDLTYAPNNVNTYGALPIAGQDLITTIEADQTNVFVKAANTTNTAYKINFYEYYHAAL